MLHQCNNLTNQFWNEGHIPAPRQWHVNTIFSFMFFLHLAGGMIFQVFKGRTVVGPLNLTRLGPHLQIQVHLLGSCHLLPLRNQETFDTLLISADNHATPIGFLHSVAIFAKLCCCVLCTVQVVDRPTCYSTSRRSYFEAKTLFCSFPC